ncbi:MAG: hypothetical protein H7338_25405 [Candidatus Sericytochromatia bacterium]|nr:hypothetical protein [Candidatus Sericytochromatia bacterium]
MRGAGQSGSPSTLSGCRIEATLPKVPIAVPVSLLIPKQDLALSPCLYDNVPDHVTDLEVHHLAANHWVYHSHPGLVNDLIRSFVQRQAGTSVTAG